MMEDEANSWIRRTKFSHTICHRLDTARLVSIPFTVESNQMGGMNSRHEKILVNPISGSVGTPIQTNPTTNKHRAVSPLPHTTLSDTFKEARSERKRFSTPHPRGKEDIVERKPSRKASGENLKSRSSNTSPLKNFSFAKFHDNGIKSKKDASWTKFFDHGGGRVTAVESADEWTVDLSELLIGYRFAHGAHSRLYHGMYKEERVAIKLIRPPDDDDNEVLGAQLEKQFNREVRLLSRLHHSNVIKFVAAGIQDPVFCIVTEYLSEGSLRAYLHKLEDKTHPEFLPLQELIKMALDIARGMEYIHSQGIIHRDLKPENILINDDFQLKIADFGIGCEESHCDSLADDPGTYRWMAPEMIKRKSYGRKVDVYGFGLILWEMISGTIPYEHMTPIQAAFAVVNKNLRPPIPVDCPPAMRALIEQCWSTHPDKRPEFWQVVKVLEQFETSLANDGTLNLVKSPTCQDHKKGLRHWIKKLGPVHHQHTSSMPKPKFS